MTLHIMKNPEQVLFLGFFMSIAQAPPKATIVIV